MTAGRASRCTEEARAGVWWCVRAVARDQATSAAQSSCLRVVVRLPRPVGLVLLLLLLLLLELTDPLDGDDVRLSARLFAADCSLSSLYTYVPIQSLSLHRPLVRSSHFRNSPRQVVAPASRSHGSLSSGRAGAHRLRTEGGRRSERRRCGGRASVAARRRPCEVAGCRALGGARSERSNCRSCRAWDRRAARAGAGDRHGARVIQLGLRLLDPVAWLPLALPPLLRQLLSSRTSTAQRQHSDAPPSLESTSTRALPPPSLGPAPSSSRLARRFRPATLSRRQPPSMLASLLLLAPLALASPLYKRQSSSASSRSSSPSLPSGTSTSVASPARPCFGRVRRADLSSPRPRRAQPTLNRCSAARLLVRSSLSLSLSSLARARARAQKPGEAALT